jgi:hypothetical protein
MAPVEHATPDFMETSRKVGRPPRYKTHQDRNSTCCITHKPGRRNASTLVRANSDAHKVPRTSQPVDARPL